MLVLSTKRCLFGLPNRFRLWKLKDQTNIKLRSRKKTSSLGEGGGGASEVRKPIEARVALEARKVRKPALRSFPRNYKIYHRQVNVEAFSPFSRHLSPSSRSRHAASKPIPAAFCSPRSSPDHARVRRQKLEGPELTPPGADPTKCSLATLCAHTAGSLVPQECSRHSTLQSSDSTFGR
jgi:hypothetical protein